jgi:outer membrane protein assembly factor BamB
MSNTIRTLKAVAPFAAAILAATVHAQPGRGGSEWLTAGGDAQRTFWIRTDPKISVPSMSQPGFELQWTSKLDNTLRGPNGLAQGVSANGVTLFVPMSIVAGSSNNIYALDNDTGYVVWQRHFDASLPAATPQCPGGITAGATRIVPLVPPPLTTPAAPGGGRAAQAYRSVIGEPGQGVPLEARGRGPAPAPAPPAAGRGAPTTAGGAPPVAAGAASPPVAPGAAGAPNPAGRGGAGPGGQPGPMIPGATPEQLAGGRGGLGRASGVVYVVTSDGVLHVLGLPSGKDIQHPAEFVPANARWSDTIAIDKTLYATTTGGCGGASNAVWAIDLESEGKPVVSWTSSGPIVGRLAFGRDGTVFASIGPGTATEDGTANAVVALDPATLKLKNWFTQPGLELATGPMVFEHNDREIVAAATKAGRILLLDAASPGGAGHSTPLYASTPLTTAGASIATDALASWREMTTTPAPPPATPPPAGAPGIGAAPAPAPPTVAYGTRWILAPTTNAIAAMKLVDADGSVTLERAWTAQSLAAPETPLIVNGVVFALATGRSATPAGRGAAAVLHAYEGTSGKELWSSGRKMTAGSSPGSFWSAFGQVYVGTNDGTLYAFGFLDERR